MTRPAPPIPEAMPASTCAQRLPPSCAATAPVSRIRPDPHNAGNMRSEWMESPKTAFYPASIQIEKGGWSTYPHAGLAAQAR
jgi:hypothetical protein